jgi:hypothetical protein
LVDVAHGQIVVHHRAIAGDLTLAVGPFRQSEARRRDAGAAWGLGRGGLVAGGERERHGAGKPKGADQGLHGKHLLFEISADGLKAKLNLI